MAETEEQKERRERFNTLAKETFGDKIGIESLKINEDMRGKESTQLWLEHNNAKRSWAEPKLTVEDYHKWLDAIEALPPKAWLIGDKCPVCGTELLGLFGSFTWGIVHGEGMCSNCQEVVFTYYHYLIEGLPPMQALAISGFVPQ